MWCDIARRLLPPTAAPPAHPHPHTPTLTDARALLPNHLLPGATHHQGRRTIAHSLAAGRPAPRSTHQSTPTSHAQSSRPPARATHDVHGHCPRTPHAHTPCAPTLPRPAPA